MALGPENRIIQASLAAGDFRKRFPREHVSRIGPPDRGGSKTIGILKAAGMEYSNRETARD